MIVKLTLGNAESFPDTQEAAKRLLADGWTLESGVIDQLPKRQIAGRETPEGYADIYRILMERPGIKDMFKQLLRLDEADQAKYTNLLRALIRARAYETRMAGYKDMEDVNSGRKDYIHEEANL